MATASVATDNKPKGMTGSARNDMAARARYVSRNIAIFQIIAIAKVRITYEKHAIKTRDIGFSLLGKAHK